MSKIKTRPTRKVLAENVKTYREEKGLTQLELARLIGWSNNYNIGLIERGEQRVNVDTLDKLANALEVLPLDLIEDWK